MPAQHSNLLLFNFLKQLFKGINKKEAGNYYAKKPPQGVSELPLSFPQALSGNPC
ncbi:MAG: hypothetical protein ACQEUK_15515 [Pseudomonadota bacterium]